MSDNRVLVIGLDAATLELARPWCEEGYLPNLKAFIDHGASGPLRAPLPVQSPASWSTFATGTNPGKHGILNFAQLPADSYRAFFANASHRRGGLFWEMAGEEGVRVGIVNLPFTYPPRPCNGFIISGMLSPGLDRRIASPQEVFEDLMEASPDYVIDVNIVRSEHDSVRHEFLDRALAAVEARTKAAVGLYRKFRPQLYCAVFTAADRVSHYFWADMVEARRNPDRAPENERFATAIRTIYQRMDTAVGALLEEAGPEADVIVLSDHGAGPLRKMFSFRRLLAEAGLLHEDRPALLRRLLKTGLLRFAHLCPRTLRQRMQNRFPGLSSRAVSQVTSGGIDFSRTKAYPTEGAEAIFVNLAGRQPEGIVSPGQECESVREKVIHLFQEVTDPDTGEPLFGGVYRREDIWHGPCLENMPDVVLEQKDWSYDTKVTSAAYGDAVFCPLRGAGKPGLYDTGRHHRTGLLMAMGPHVRNVEIERAEMADVPATILALLGCPIPDSFDGRVLTEILSDDVDIPARVRDDSDRQRQSRDFSEEDRDAVEKRLKGLGYL